MGLFLGVDAPRSTAIICTASFLLRTSVSSRTFLGAVCALRDLAPRLRGPRLDMTTIFVNSIVVPLPQLTTSLLASAHHPPGAIAA